MYCKNCGKPIDEEAKFCENCGKGRIGNTEQAEKVEQHIPIIESAPTNSAQVNVVYKSQGQEKKTFFIIAIIANLLGLICYLFFNYYIGIAIVAVSSFMCLILSFTRKNSKKRLTKLSAVVFSVALIVVGTSYFVLENKMQQMCHDYYEEFGKQKVEDCKSSTGFFGVYEIADDYVAISNSDLHQLKHSFEEFQKAIE